MADTAGDKLGEFALIRRYFDRPVPAGSAVALGVGDDCALLQASHNAQWAISTDMLVSGRHFFPDVAPRHLGHKALAVNLSDLAACGAIPKAFTLALALPEADADWLQGFSDGLLALAQEHGCVLMGGDTTRGPLTISITVMGQVPAGQALLRHLAQPGDDIYVSGTLGDAALGLRTLQGRIALPPALRTIAVNRLELPTPRVALGQALLGIAHAAADISDGLCGDLGHILERSHASAVLERDALLTLSACASSGDFDSTIPPDVLLDCVLYGGDDYELVFTAAPSQRADVLAAAQAAGTRATRIGRIAPQDHASAHSGIRLQHSDGSLHACRRQGFDHFFAP